MPPSTSVQVEINSRTLRIGGQTYSLGNLARVQIVKLAKPSRAGKGNIKLAVLAGYGFSVFVAVIALSTGVSAINFVGGFLAIGLGILVYRKTKEPYIPRYSLMLETTGNPHAALVSTDRAELERVSGDITNAMANPPKTVQVITVSNVIWGDQYNQIGDHNIGKVGGNR